MDDSTPLGPNPSGLCWCGCGKKTLPATSNYRGHVVGQPRRFIHGHRAGSCIEYIPARKGYPTFTRGGDRKLAHRRVWEQHNGPIPEGHVIHHIDGDHNNFEITNLMAVTETEHHRIHAGWEMRGGEWWKPCRRCGEMKPVSAFYPKRTPGGPAYETVCKACNTAHCRESRHRNRARAS